ncbi:molybdopterin-binding protein [Gordonia sp. X0973]|uniref:molybdopterin-binding protein n=1 Tax=Gordonia sp. X0973 TaxID=2742602 RepID=UPI0034643A26
MLHTSGDEVGATAAGGIADTASPLVRELLARTGIRVATGAHLPDTADAVRDAVGPDRMPGELVVIIGATGRGTADHLRAALDAVGAVILVDGLPIRPGGSLIVAALPTAAPCWASAATRSPPSPAPPCARRRCAMPCSPRHPRRPTRSPSTTPPNSPTRHCGGSCRSVRRAPADGSVPR